MGAFAEQAIGEPGCLLIGARSAEMFTGIDLAGAARGGRTAEAVMMSPITPGM